jgi:transcriptional regulator with XRE-family HTH domain
MSVGNRNETVWDSIRRVRDSLLLTQEELGTRAGVSTYAISNVENNHVRPRYATIRKIAAALRVDPRYLWTGEGDPHPKPEHMPGLEEVRKVPLVEDTAPADAAAYLQERCGTSLLTEERRAINDRTEELGRIGDTEGLDALLRGWHCNLDAAREGSRSPELSSELRAELRDVLRLARPKLLVFQAAIERVNKRNRDFIAEAERILAESKAITASIESSR